MKLLSVKSAEAPVRFHLLHFVKQVSIFHTGVKDSVCMCGFFISLMVILKVPQDRNQCSSFVLVLEDI